MELISWPGGSWEATLKMAIAVVAIYLAAIWITLVFWTYRDVRQRTRDPIMQSIAVLLVLFFFLPGHWIYLILRPRYTLAEAYERSLEEEALLQELEDQKSCPSCKRRVYDDYLICPACRTQLKEPCEKCSKPLSYAWSACPFCGLEKPARQPAARPPRVSARARDGAVAAPVRRAPSADGSRRGPRPGPAPVPVRAPEAVVERKADSRSTAQGRRPAVPTDPFASSRPVKAVSRGTSDAVAAPQAVDAKRPDAKAPNGTEEGTATSSEDGALIDATPQEVNGKSERKS